MRGPTRGLRVGSDGLTACSGTLLTSFIVSPSELLFYRG